jgi:hypothetical protein
MYAISSLQPVMVINTATAAPSGHILVAFMVASSGDRP